MDVLYLLLGSFNNLPSWIRWVFILLSLGIALGFGAFMSPIVGLIVAGGLLVVVLLLAAFKKLLKWRREKRAAAFGTTVETHNASGLPAINDPARIERLKDLRRTFQAGIEKFAAAGKNLYELPWYVIIGEAGAGKTEAIRHSSIGFPPGMHDEFQGVGGTINMNWWFTDHAVILDTAGRIVFEEVPPGSTSEWREFLKLLKTHRPNCPINGLMLVLPAESLIKDTGEEVVQKAGRIATQLEVIQKQLDIRFPVYVVVSKCDLLNGFREFFDELTEESAAHQIVGWSNPDPIDQPFRPELVDSHIWKISQRLTRRRLGLLLDPAPRSAERRADEVDRLFALPHSIGLIGRNLQRYLQTLFMPGKWTSRPLFLRGIYFTSSMREGYALDQELANAMGLSVDALPEGRAWDRKRSYFLRDVFTGKAFLEKGLVTRASDTGKLLRQRRFTLFAAGVAALLLLLGFSVLGHHQLRERIGRQGGHWARAAEGWDEKNEWSPIVQPDGPDRFRYVGDQPMGPGMTSGESSLTRRLFDSAKLSLADFHADLSTLSAEDLPISSAFWLKKQFSQDIQEARRPAQRVVFEGSVIAPTLRAARQRMSKPEPVATVRGDQAAAEDQALLALIRIEAGVVMRHKKRAPANVSAEEVLSPLVQYSSEREPDEALLQTMDRLHLQPDSQWPAPWTSGGSPLSENTAINQGLARFLARAQAAIAQYARDEPLLRSLIVEVRNFEALEDGLYSAPTSLIAPEEVDKAVNDAFSRLQDQRQTLDRNLQHARDVGLFPHGEVSLLKVFERILALGDREFATAQEIEQTLRAIMEAGAGAGASDGAVGGLKGREFFREIHERLKPVSEQLRTLRQASGQLDRDQLRQLDKLHLAGGEGSKLQYLIRWNLYEQASNAARLPRHPATLELIGTDWKELFAAIGETDRVEVEVKKYRGELSEMAIGICAYRLEQARRLHYDEFCRAYHAQGVKKLRASVRFPLVWLDSRDQRGPLSAAELLDADALVERINTDLQSPNFIRIPAAYTKALSDFRKEQLSRLEPIRKALINPKPPRALRHCTIVLLSRDEQQRASGLKCGLDDYRAIELRAGPVKHVDKRQAPIPTDSPSEQPLERSFPLDQAFHFHLYPAAPDSEYVDIPEEEEWTALWLADKNAASRSNGGQTFRAAISERVGGKQIMVELRFEEPLPEFENWPTLTKLGL